MPPPYNVFYSLLQNPRGLERQEILQAFLAGFPPVFVEILRRNYSRGEPLLPKLKQISLFLTPLLSQGSKIKSGHQSLKNLRPVLVELTEAYCLGQYLLSYPVDIIAI